MQSVSQSRKFYRIAALSMIAVGSALLIFSVADILNQRTMCQDNLYVGGDVLAAEPDRCVDPMFEIGWSSYNGFINVILAICLLAFGGSIIGMITRLGN